jgi:hypothetical protein
MEVQTTEKKRWTNKMVDSLPPSGTDPDNQTIITNSNDKLSVALDGLTLDVGSSGKIEVFETTQYLASFEDNDSGDWTGINQLGNSVATVWVDESELPKSASVTADLTGIDVLNFRIQAHLLKVRIKVNGVELATIGDTDFGYETIEISGLDDFGTNSTVKIEAYDDWDGSTGNFVIDYIRTNPSQPESRKVELVDTGGL